MVPRLLSYRRLGVTVLFKDSDFAMRVYENSMSPTYPSGCLIALKRNCDTYIQPGETYVVETCSNRILTRLYWNESKTAFECYSDNTDIHHTGPQKGEYIYAPFEIALHEVVRLFDVLGVIRRNTSLIRS